MSTVAVIHPSLNFRGGAERVCLTIIETLKEAGFKVALLTIDSTDWKGIEESFGVHVKPDIEVPMNNINLAKVRMSLLRLASLFTKILKLLSKLLRYDFVINTYGEFDLINSFVDIAYVNSFPFSTSFIYKEKMPSILRENVIRIAYNVLHKMSSALPRRRRPVIISNSSYIRDIIAPIYAPREITIIHPPCRFESPYKKVGRRENTVIVISRFSRGKMLETIPVICKHTTSWKFVVVGSASKESEHIIENLQKSAKDLGVADRLKIVPNAPKKVLLQLLAKSKVYLHVARNEPFGISVVEAMAMGCVPIVHKSGGVWYDILEARQGYYGYGYDNYSEAPYYIKMLEDDNVYKELSTRAKERATTFDVKVFKEKFIKKVREVIERFSCSYVGQAEC